MFDAMRFWLDRGVAGFRLDAIPTLFEDPQLRDEPETGGINAQGDPNLNDIYTDNLPEVHDVMRRMRAMVDRYPGDRVLIGETYLPNTAELDKWYGGAAAQRAAAADGHAGRLSRRPRQTRRRHVPSTRSRRSRRRCTARSRCWSSTTTTMSAASTASATAQHNEEIAKLLAALLLHQPRHRADVLRRRDRHAHHHPTRNEDVKDPIGITGWPKEKGRDGERTPMQWDASDPQAGFSTNSKTWLPVPANYTTINVKTELADPNSLLNWHKQLIAMRRTNPALHDGGIVMIDTSNPSVLSYVRTAPPGKPSVVVSLNMTAEPQTVSLDLTQAGVQGQEVKTLLASDPAMAAVTSTKTITLPPFASWIASVP